jgi:hypothetical protein
MKRLAVLLALVAVAGCRNYDNFDAIADQDGLVPPDVYATYGREQAIVVAVGREYARPYNSGAGAQARIATAYARKFPEVVNVTADTLGNRLTIHFKDGWIAAVVPIDDGKTGDDTHIPS